MCPHHVYNVTTLVTGDNICSAPLLGTLQLSRDQGEAGVDKLPYFVKIHVITNYDEISHMLGSVVYKLLEIHVT